MLKRLADHWQKQAERIASMIDVEDELPNVYDALDSDGERQALVPVLQQNMQRLAEVGAWEILAKWNPESSGWAPAVIEGWIRAAAETNAGRWIHSVENHLAQTASAEDPRGALTAYLDGQGPVPALGGSFATEAVAFGRHDAAKKSGLDQKTWKTTVEDPRPEHAELDGVTIGIDDQFANGLRWPGDYSGNSAETAGCTCILDYGKDDS